MDTIRYPEDSFNLNYAINDYLHQYRDIKIFSEEYAKEPLMIPHIRYTDMKTVYPIQVINQRFQVAQKNLTRIQLFKKIKGDLDNAHIDGVIFTILFRRRESKMVSGRNENTENKII